MIILLDGKSPAFGLVPLKIAACPRLELPWREPEPSLILAQVNKTHSAKQTPSKGHIQVPFCIAMTDERNTITHFSVILCLAL